MNIYVKSILLATMEFHYRFQVVKSVQSDDIRM